MRISKVNIEVSVAQKVSLALLIPEYFQTVAYKRFADNIPLAIDHELVRGAERDVLQALITGLGINGPNAQRICRELAQENPSVASRREELTKKLERMQVASRQLLQT